MLEQLGDYKGTLILADIYWALTMYQATGIFHRLFDIIFKEPHELLVSTSIISVTTGVGSDSQRDKSTWHKKRSR